MTEGKDESININTDGRHTRILKIKAAIISSLRDPIWQFYGAVIGFLGIGVAILLTIRSQPTKSLEVTVLANTRVIEIEQSIAEDIQLLYKGREIADLSLVQVKLENTGSRPIVPEDYVRPISLVFPEEVELLDARIEESRPANIGMSLQITTSRVILSPELLNPTDRVIVRFLITSAQSENPPFTIDARIVEVQDIAITTAIDQTARPSNQGWPVPTLGDILTFVIRLFFTIAGLSALFYLLLGALIWVTSGGSKDVIEAAQRRIIAAVAGIVLIVLILSVIVTIERLFGLSLGISAPLVLS